MSRVLLVAAEASSALYAQRLLELWKRQKTSIEVFGVGSEQMEALGFERFGKSEEMAVVGAAEVIEHYSHLKAVFHRLLKAAEEKKPDVAVLMDYPDFNLMLAKKLKKMGIPVVYYISPQVWAWRKGRIHKIKKYCDKVLVLFPFEMKFYQEYQVPCEFVGHPLLDEVEDSIRDDKSRQMYRGRCGIQEDDIVVGLMPGSRRGEIQQHLQIQLEVARRLYASHPRVKVLLMCAPTVDKESLQEQLGDYRFPLILQKEDPANMIQLADVILAASGTATLLVGLLEKPMVIMYKMKWLTGLVAKVVVRGVKYFGLVNLVMGREIVPERWQSGTHPDVLYGLMKKYLDEPEYREKVIEDLRQLRQHLGNKGATVRVAQALAPYLQGNR